MTARSWSTLWAILRRVLSDEFRGWRLGFFMGTQFATLALAVVLAVTSLFHGDYPILLSCIAVLAVLLAFHLGRRSKEIRQ